MASWPEARTGPSLFPSNLGVVGLVGDRSMGNRSSRSFRDAVLQSKCRNFSFLDDVQVVSPHTGAIVLSMDRIEHRFLLSGGHDATLAVYDLSQRGTDEYIHGVRNTKAYKRTMHGTTGRAGSTFPHAAQSWRRPRQTYQPVARSVRAPIPSVDAPSATTTTVAPGHWSSVIHTQWYTFDTGAFLSGSTDGSVLMWDTESMQPAVRWQPLPSLSSMELSASSGRSQSLLTVGSTDESLVKLVDIRSGACSHSFTGHRGGITTVRWSPYCDVVMASGGTDGTVRLWDIRKAGSRAVITTLDRDASNDGILANRDPPKGHEWHSNYKRPFGTDFHHLRANTKKKMAPNNYQEVEVQHVRSHGNAVSGLAFEKDGRTLVSTGRDGKLHVWDLRGNGQLEPLDFRSSVTSQHAVNTSRSGMVPLWIQNETETVVVGKGSDLLVYSLRSGGTPIQQLSGHLGSVSSIEWNDGSMQLFSGGTDGMIIAWGRDDAQQQAERHQQRQRHQYKRRRPDNQAYGYAF